MKDYLEVLKTGWLGDLPDIASIQEELAAYGWKELMRFSREARWIAGDYEFSLDSPLVSTVGKVWHVRSVPYHDKRWVLIEQCHTREIARYALIEIGDDSLSDTNSLY